METTVKERLTKYLKINGISQRKFEIAVGLSNGYVNNIRKSIQPDKIEQISTQYPELNTGWLMTGVGEMLINNSIVREEATPLYGIQYMMIPFVPLTARAGYLRGFGDEEYIENLTTIPVIVDRNYRGKYRVFEVAGDSMEDGTLKSLLEHDKILCREVAREHWGNKLHYKDWFFVIVHKSEGISVKEITQHNTSTGEITCHSLNAMFSDFKLNLSDVCELYSVVKIIERNTRK